MGSDHLDRAQVRDLGRDAAHVVFNCGGSETTAAGCVARLLDGSDPADTGSVVGQVDDGPPVVLEPAHHLAQGDRFAEEALLEGGGDAIVVTWLGQIAQVASFPIETPDCPTDPVDERAAQQATTTLGAPNARSCS